MSEPILLHCLHNKLHLALVILIVQTQEERVLTYIKEL